MIQRYSLDQSYCDGESGRCRAQIVPDNNGDLVDFNPNVAPIEEISLERIGAGFGKMLVVVKAKIDGKWIELIRDRETSSNNHSVTSKQIVDLFGKRSDG